MANTRNEGDGRLDERRDEAVEALRAALGELESEDQSPIPNPQSPIPKSMNILY